MTIGHIRVTDTNVLAERYGISPDALRKQASRTGLSKPWPETMCPWIEGDVCVIPLHSRRYTGKLAYQFDWVSKHRWHVALPKNGRIYYARTNIECKPVSLHVILMKPPKGMVVDHKDGDGLNNRRCNLRIATHQGNAANSHHPDRAKGVFKFGSRYRAMICRYFPSEYEAAKAYDCAASERWGEFASLNYPEEAIDDRPIRHISSVIGRSP